MLRSFFVLFLILIILFSGCLTENQREIEKNIEKDKINEIENSKNNNLNENEIIEKKDLNVKDVIDKKIVQDINKEIGIENNIKDSNKKTNFSRKEIISNSKRWIFQLQKTNFNEILNSDINIFVIDIDDSKFTFEQIEKIKKNKKIVISYLSIGEAEDYKDYWKEEWNTNPPIWLDKENPNWKGNYKVGYWNKEWQEIILNKLDKIVELGYDGVYLDIIDAYEYYETMSSVNSRQEMIDFVKKISERSKSKNSEFLIIPQNALSLLKSDEYLNIIDGVGKEDTWFMDNNKRKNSDVNWVLNYLKKVIANKKFVLAIDYPKSIENKCFFYTKSENEKFISSVSNRELDKLTYEKC